MIAHLFEQNKCKNKLKISYNTVFKNIFSVTSQNILHSEKKITSITIHNWN